MKSVKPKTYGELKCRKAELISEIVKGNHDREVLKEYHWIVQVIKNVESWLLWTIVSLMLIVSGCNLAREGLYGTGRCIGALVDG